MANLKSFMEDAMLMGNELYDKLAISTLLYVDEVLERVPEVAVKIHSEVFFGPSSLNSAAQVLVAAASGGASGGVCVLTPISFAVSFSAGQFIFADSHAHRNGGALIAVVPAKSFLEYFQYFFDTHYGCLGFNTSDGQEKRAHLTVLALN